MTLIFVFIDIFVLVFLSHEIRKYVRVYTGLQALRIAYRGLCMRVYIYISTRSLMCTHMVCIQSTFPNLVHTFRKYLSISKVRPKVFYCCRIHA